jgi:hypothetical protein
VSALTGDYMSLAEAAGETVHHRGWVAGVDFDPSDPHEMEVMDLVWERERLDELARLREENETLWRRVAELTGADELE